MNTTITSGQEHLYCSGTFQLIYGNKLVAGTRSRALKADSIVHAVVLVLGGCDSINGNSYKVGKLFGTVEKLS